MVELELVDPLKKENVILLEHEMSHLSEMIYSSGWDSGFEFQCWDIVSGKAELQTYDGTMRNGASISDGRETVERIKSLSDLLNGWICGDGEYFCSLQEWETYRRDPDQYYKALDLLEDRVSKQD